MRRIERAAGKTGQGPAAADRVLQLRPVKLDGVRRGGRGAAALCHRAAHDGVVCEHQVGALSLQLAGQRRRVQLEVALQLGVAEVADQPGLDSLVAVEHERRQQRTRLGADEAHARAQREPLRVRLLAEHAHVVAEPRPGAGHVLRVDVGAGPGQQVAVPEDEVHDAPGSWKGTRSIEARDG